MNQVCGVGGVWRRPGRAILAGYDDARRHLAFENPVNDRDASL
jgi:hypothetical protein